MEANDDRAALLPADAPQPELGPEAIDRLGMEVERTTTLDGRPLLLFSFPEDDDE